MDKVIIKDLHLQAILGIRDWEREILQDILINLEIFTQTRPASALDGLAGCVDYSELVKEIRDLVKASRRYTVEALAEDIARICLAKAGVKKVTVRLVKPGAISGAASAGVEIERDNPS